LKDLKFDRKANWENKDPEITADNIREFLNNKGKIENLCIENNIDMNINKKIISHISIQELKSKIEFLKENGISLLDEKGKLHEIFAMSSTNMQVKYGVSLEELINKYYVTSMEKGGI